MYDNNSSFPYSIKEAHENGFGRSPSAKRSHFGADPSDDQRGAAKKNLRTQKIDCGYAIDVILMIVL